MRLADADRQQMCKVGGDLQRGQLPRRGDGGRCGMGVNYAEGHCQSYHTTVTTR